MTMVGLVGMAAGACSLSVLPATFGVSGYVAPIVVIIAGSLFQTANNNVVMTGIAPDQRGVISGSLNLLRNLGLITGASIMGAVFALSSATASITTAFPAAVATGIAGHVRSRRRSDRRRSDHRSGKSSRARQISTEQTS